MSHSQTLSVDVDVNGTAEINLSAAFDGLSPADSLGVMIAENAAGLALLGARTKEGLSVEKLSRLTGVEEGVIRGIETGEIDIDQTTARRLVRELNINWRIFF